MIHVVLYPSPDWQKYLDLVIDPSFNAELSFSHRRVLNPLGVEWLAVADWVPLEAFGSWKSLSRLDFFVLNPWKGYRIWEKKHAGSWVVMWVGLNCKDVTWEEGKYGGLIQSSSVKDRGDYRRQSMCSMCY